MTTTQIDVSAIAEGSRLRTVDPDWVEAIAASMADHGQDTPIIVRPLAGGFQLVAGLHRLTAARRLGWPTITAKVHEMDDLQAQLVEVDENLMRRELSELDRAAFLARRKHIWQQLHPHTVRRGPIRDKVVFNSDQPLEERFSKATAAKLGLSPRAIDRAIARAVQINDITRRMLTGHPVAANGAQLDLLAKLDHGDQLRVVRELTGEENPARTVRGAMLRLGLVKAAPEPDRDYASTQAMARAWDTASPAARARFLAVIGAEMVRV